MPGNSKRSVEHLKEYQFKPGQSGNPSGRPKGTLKDFVRQMFIDMDEKEKAQWLKAHKISGIDIWKMGEGNPTADVELKGNLSISQVLDELENGSKTEGQNVETEPPVPDPQ